MHGILWHETIGSTNSGAAEIAPQADNLTVVAAKNQTAGRGQRGNAWSHSADDLAFSVIIRPGEDGIPAVAAAAQFALCESAALSVAEYLRSRGAAPEIKWPNDIYCGDSKICGILIENTVRDSFVTGSIAGIGINLNRTAFPDWLPNPTSLRLLTGRRFGPEEELESFMEIFRKRIAVSGSRSQREEYESMMYRKDSPSRFIDLTLPGGTDARREIVSGKEFSGIIRGVSPTGLLRIEMPDGSRKDFAFKEISYIL